MIPDSSISYDWIGSSSYEDYYKFRKKGYYFFKQYNSVIDYEVFHVENNMTANRSLYTIYNFKPAKDEY